MDDLDSIVAQGLELLGNLLTEDPETDLDDHLRTVTEGITPGGEDLLRLSLQNLDVTLGIKVSPESFSCMEETEWPLCVLFMAWEEELGRRILVKAATRGLPGQLKLV
jgi:hypothetical protein